MKFSETYIKLMQLMQRRNVGKISIRKYNIVFREIYELTGKTPSQLIAETKKKEQSFTNEKGNPQILYLSERKVNSYQLLYNIVNMVKFIIINLYLSNYITVSCVFKFFKSFNYFFFNFFCIFKK
jgi:hypothetical protein